MMGRAPPGDDSAHPRGVARTMQMRYGYTANEEEVGV
jgi:hypothetical protein